MPLINKRKSEVYKIILKVYRKIIGILDYFFAYSWVRQADLR